MAVRRMIHQDVICCDDFLDMSFEAQALFFQLQIKADEYGFVQSPRGVLRMMNAGIESLEALIEKRFVLRFRSGVIVMAHWNMANTRRADREAKMRFPEEYSRLIIDKTGVYSMRDDSDIPLSSQREGNGSPSISISSSHSVSPSRSPSVNQAVDEASSSASNTRARAREDNDDHTYSDSLESFLGSIPFIGGMTEKVLEYRAKLPDELIRYGVERAQECGGKSIRYVKVILDGFVSRGYKTVEQAEADEQKRELAKIRNPNSPRYDPKHPQFCPKEEEFLESIYGGDNKTYADPEDFY